MATVEFAQSILESMTPDLRRLAERKLRRTRAHIRMDADDIMQEVAMRVVANAHTCRGKNENEVRGWIWRIASNRIKGGISNQLDLKKRSMRVEVHMDGKHFRQDGTTHEAEVELWDDMARVKKAMRQLSDVQQDVMRALFFDMESPESIAKRLGITRNAVKCIKYRALESLRANEDLIVIGDPEAPGFIIDLPDGAHRKSRGPTRLYPVPQAPAQEDAARDDEPKNWVQQRLF